MSITNTDELHALLVERMKQYDLDSTLAPLFTSRSTLNAELNRLEGYSELSPQLQHSVNAWVKTIQLELRLKNLQSNPGNPKEQGKIDRLALEIHEHLQGGDEVDWVPSRLWLSTAKRMAVVAGTDAQPDYSLMSRNDAMAKEHAWFDTDWFSDGTSTPVPKFLSGAKLAVAPSAEPTVPTGTKPNPAISETHAGKPSTGHRDPAPTGPRENTSTTGQKTVGNSKPATSSRPLNAEAEAGSVNPANLSAKITVDNSQLAVNRGLSTAGIGSGSARRKKSEKVKSKEYVESGDERVDAPAVEEPKSLGKGKAVEVAGKKRKADEASMEGSSMGRNQRARSMTSDSVKIVEAKVAHGDTRKAVEPPCDRCRKAEVACVRQSGVACARCRSFKSHCSLVVGRKRRGAAATSVDTAKQPSRKRKVKAEPEEIAIKREPPNETSVPAPAPAPDTDINNANTRADPAVASTASPSGENANVKKKATKPKTLAALVPASIPRPIVIPATPAPPNPDLAKLHETMVRVDVVEQQQYNLHQANLNLQQENDALRGMVETLRRHLLEVSSTVDHLQGLVSQQATRQRAGSPDSILTDGAGNVTNTGIQTDDVAATDAHRTPNAGTAFLLVEPIAAIMDVDVPSNPETRDAAVATASPKDGAVMSVALIAPSALGITTSTPVTSRVSAPQTPSGPGNSTQQIIGGYHTPSEAGNTSWDERAVELEPGELDTSTGHPPQAGPGDWSLMFHAALQNPHPVNDFTHTEMFESQEARFTTVCPEVLHPVNPADSFVDPVGIENSGIDLQPSLITDIAYLAHSNHSSPTNAS